MTGIDPSRLAEAAAWRARSSGQHMEDIPELAAWLAADPQNAAAWREVQETWAFLGDHAAAPEVIELRRQALEHAHAHAANRTRWARSRQFARTSRLAIAAMVGAIAIGAAILWQASGPDVYRTSVGERRVITLTDGSQIALDSRSEVSVRYTKHSRELVLTSGQARFDVAHDSERPFSVSAGGHKVIATGTAFNVDLLASRLLVTLIEGHVIVAPSSSLPPLAGTRLQEMPNRTVGTATNTPPSFALDAGDQLVLSPSASPSIVHVNVDRTTAWENGEVIFENDPLSAVVARINRYTQHRIVIDDTATAELRISGVFHTGDVEGFISTVVSYLPVRAQRTPDGTIRLLHRDRSGA
jgi:transmembrane sensor